MVQTTPRLPVSCTRRAGQKNFVKKILWKKCFFGKNKIGHFEILNFLNFRFFFERLFLMWSLSTLELKVFFIYGGWCAKFPLGGEKLQSFFFESSRPSPGMLGAPPRLGGRRVGSVLVPSKMGACSLSTLKLKVLGWDGGRCAKFTLGGEKIQSFLGQVEASNLSLRFDSWSLDVGFQFWTLTFHFWRLLRALEFQLWGLEFELWRLEFAFWELELESWISRAEVGILNCSVYQSRRTLEVLKFASPKLTFWNLQRWIWKSRFELWIAQSINQGGRLKS